MLIKAVSNRYAKAIYDIAVSSGLVEPQLADLVRVSVLFADHKNLARAVESPTVPSAVKKRILKDLLSDHVSTTTLHFLYVLVDKSREVYIDGVLESYRELNRIEQDVAKCHVRVASALTKKLTTQLTKNLEEHTGKKVELVVEHDPSMLGGMIITIGDTIIDGSLDTQLQQIQERLATAGSH